MSVRLRGRCVRPPRRKHSVPDARPSEGGEGKKLGDPRRDPGHAVGGPEDVQEDRRPRRDEHLHGGGVLMIRFAAVILAVLLLASGSRGEEGEPPRIFLEKKIFEETSTGRKNFYEVHTVSQGEGLWRIPRGDPDGQGSPEEGAVGLPGRREGGERFHSRRGRDRRRNDRPGSYREVFREEARDRRRTTAGSPNPRDHPRPIRRPGPSRG